MEIELHPAVALLSETFKVQVAPVEMKMQLRERQDGRDWCLCQVAEGPQGFKKGIPSILAEDGGLWKHMVVE
jgi:hypothetical protein